MVTARQSARPASAWLRPSHHSYVGGKRMVIGVELGDPEQIGIVPGPEQDVEQRAGSFPTSSNAGWNAVINSSPFLSFDLTRDNSATFHI